ncbi:MAG: complex I subunit 4 family protein, partial [Bryobacteraceae bacterium]
MNALDFILFAPLVGFLILLLVPRSKPQSSRMLALVISIVVFLVSLALIAPFWFASPHGFQFATDVPWIATPQIHYHVGIDGLSLWLVLLTTLLTPICVLVSWKYIDKRVKEYYAFLILLEFGMMGTFVALDLFLFYVFWEVSLVPMYFLIGIWGHERRVYAAVKFFLYTFAGSVLMLTAIIYLYNVTGSMDYPAVLAAIGSGRVTLHWGTQMLLFLGFFIAFAIKVP